MSTEEKKDERSQREHELSMFLGEKEQKEALFWTRRFIQSCTGSLALEGFPATLKASVSANFSTQMESTRSPRFVPYGAS